MTDDRLVDDLLSGDSSLVVPAAWAILKTRDPEVLAPLVSALPAIRRATADLDLGGMLVSHHTQDEIGATPSIGTVADSYDNVLAESVNGYYKAELIRGPARESRPWKSVEDVELATLSWVHWHNTQRFHGYLGDVPPAEYEQTFYARPGTDQSLVGIQ